MACTTCSEENVQAHDIQSSRKHRNEYCTDRCKAFQSTVMNATEVAEAKSHEQESRRCWRETSAMDRPQSVDDATNCNGKPEDSLCHCQCRTCLLSQAPPGPMCYQCMKLETEKNLLCPALHEPNIKPAPKKIVDLGCGSGILTIAAAKLWPASNILAVDNDELAVEVCKENIKKNSLAAKITIKHCSAIDVKGRFNLVLANLFADLLTELRAKITNAISDPAHILLSGLTAEQAPQLSLHYSKDAKIEHEYCEELDGWRAMLFKTLD